MPLRASALFGALTSLIVTQASAAKDTLTLARELGTLGEVRVVLTEDGHDRVEYGETLDSPDGFSPPLEITQLSGHIVLVPGNLDVIQGSELPAGSDVSQHASGPDWLFLGRDPGEIDILTSSAEVLRFPVRPSPSLKVSFKASEDGLHWFASFGDPEAKFAATFLLERSKPNSSPTLLNDRYYDLSESRIEWRPNGHLAIGGYETSYFRPDAVSYVAAVDPRNPWLARELLERDYFLNPTSERIRYLRGIAYSSSPATGQKIMQFLRKGDAIIQLAYLPVVDILRDRHPSIDCGGVFDADERGGS